VTKEEKTPIKRFAGFFRGYGIALGVIVAAMPLVVRTGGLLPSYQAVRDTVKFATSLVTFLAIAFLFGFRRQIGEAVFPVKLGRSINREQRRRRTQFAIVTPVVLATLAVFSLFGYLVFLNLSVSEVVALDAMPMTKEHVNQVLSDTAFFAIPFLTLICLTYTLMFFAAATAFVWGGLIEYVQGELGIRDAELLSKSYVLMNRQDFKLEDDSALPHSVPFFYFEWDPESAQLVTRVTGPLCETHDRQLVYEGKFGVAQHQWACINPEKKADRHVFTLTYDPVTMKNIARAIADDLLRKRLGG